jgi:hypothetical protein
MPVTAIHEVVPDAVLPAEEIGVLGTVIALEDFAAAAAAGLDGPLGLQRKNGSELSSR